MRRSTVDPEFRALALRDSAAAIAKVSPAGPPVDQKITFVDNSGPVLTIALPDPAPSDQLSEMELESVAGGTVAIQGQWSKSVSSD